MKTGFLKSSTMVWACMFAIVLSSVSAVCAADEAKLSRIITRTSSAAIPLVYSWNTGTNPITGVTPSNATVQRVDIQLTGYCLYGDYLDFYLSDASGDHSFHIDTTGWYDEGSFNETITGITAFNGLPVNQAWTLYGMSISNVGGEYVNSWKLWITYDDGVGQTMDLGVVTSSCTPLSVTKGDTLTLTSTIGNAGNTICGASKATWFISTNPTPTASDTALATWNVAGLSADGSSNNSQTVAAPSTPGTYYLSLKADSQSAVAESNENNNWGSVFTLTVADRDTDGDGVLDGDDEFPFNACGSSDTDGDGIADEWEMLWFGNLTTANATSDFDNDGTSDLREFLACSLGSDPTQSTSRLPVDGVGSLAILSVALMGAFRTRGARRARRFSRR